MIRPMTSNVAALSSIVANGHQAIHFVSSAPSKIPYGGFSPVKCGAPHFTGYVAKQKMWRRGPERPHLLGFPDFLRHILFGSYKVLRKPIKPFRGEGPLTALSLSVSPPLGATGNLLVGNRAGEMTVQQDSDDSQLAGVAQERRTGRAPSRQVFQKGVPLLSQRSVGVAQKHSRVMK